LAEQVADVRAHQRLVLDDEHGSRAGCDNAVHDPKNERAAPRFRTKVCIRCIAAPHSRRRSRNMDPTKYEIDARAPDAAAFSQD